MKQRGDEGTVSTDSLRLAVLRSCKGNVPPLCFIRFSNERLEYSSAVEGLETLFLLLLRSCGTHLELYISRVFP